MTRRRALWAAGIATVVLLAVLAIVDAELRSTGGPGIVAYELASSTERVAVIFGHWGQSGRDAATLSLWIDFLFLVAYGAFLYLAVRAVGDAARARGFDTLARPATAIAALPLAAAAFDVLENAGLLWMLDGRAQGRGPALVTAFATAKFALLAITLVYLLVALAVMVRVRLRNADGEPAGGAPSTPPG